MLNDNAKKWVAALRSGKYKQGKGRLRDGNKFCCLGVACEIYRLKHPKSKWDNDQFYSFGETRAAHLTQSVRRWLGLKDSAGTYGDGSTSLSFENDKGISFIDIAKIIKSNPRGLFKK